MRPSKRVDFTPATDRASRRVAGVLALMTFAAFARTEAQSIDPPIAVFDGKANGRLVIANPSLYPVNFVLESKSFTVGCNGDITFGPLDTARIHLSLSAMSGRVPAKQNVRIYYQASADSLPSWFAIIASFRRTAPEGGLSVRLELPQIVYLMQRQRASESDIAIGTVTYDSATRVVRTRVENRGAKLTRVQGLTIVSSTGQSVLTDAGPLFPNSARDYEHHWKLPGTPVSAVVEFEGFKLTRPIAALPCTVLPPAR